MALASALARSFFLKHNLHKKKKSHFSQTELELCVSSTPATEELPWVQSTVEERDPQPTHQQEDEHERESKGKPGAEVDQLALWEIAERQRKCFKPPRVQQFGCVLVLPSSVHVFSCPIRMRLGAVPVRVAVPPMLAE